MRNRNLKKLILCPEERNFPDQLTEMDDVVWFYLGRDYERLLDLTKKLPQKWNFIDIGDYLNETAYELRRPYIDYIGELSVRFNSLSWWISRVAEKNVMVSPLFLYVNYLMIFRRLLAQGLKDKNVCVISESPALLETIAGMREVEEFKIVKSYNFDLIKFKGYLVSLVRLMYFIMRSIFSTIAVTVCPLAQNGSSSKPLTIVRSWVSDKNLGKDMEFKDSYFPGLAGFLKKKNIRIAVLPVLYNIKFSFFKALRWFRQSNTDFIIPEDYYRVNDYCDAIALSYKSSTIFKNNLFHFKGIDLSFLFRGEALKQLFSSRTMEMAMHYHLFKRLKERNVNIERVIITFENMFPEKPIMMGVKQFFSKAKTVGFQHSSLYPLLLSLYTSKKESEIMPLPERIVCSGDFFVNTLAKEGFPSSKLCLGPALRFAHLFNKDVRDPQASKKVILVTLPLARTNAMELIAKVTQAIKDVQGYKVWLKPHPMMSDNEIKSIFLKLGLRSEDYTIVGGKMGDVLRDSAILIGTASGTIFEASACGVPSLRVQSDIDLSLDPMDWFSRDESQFVARTPEEISKQIDRILSLDEKQLELLNEKGKQLIDQCFSSVNEKNLMAFIQD